MDFAEFEGYTVGHPHLDAADADLRGKLAHPEDSALVFLFGPSGVGKSTLLEHVQRSLIEAAAERMAAEPAYRPFIAVEAEAPEKGAFAWRGLYEDLLGELDEPGIRWKVDPERDRDERGRVGRRLATVAVLRHALVTAIRQRGIPVIFIDEAHHIGITASGRRLLNELDHLKTLANRSGAVIVLAGTYRLETFRNQSDQVSRRSHDVHLRRYRRAEADDIAAFEGVTDHFAELLPLKFPQPTEALRTLLYEGSWGCVGPLRNWMLRAARRAAAEGRSRVTRKDLVATRTEAGKLRAIAQAIFDGEKALAHAAKDLAEVSRLLGGAAVPPSPRADALAVAATKRRPGQRKPRRELVGKTDLDQQSA